ncbi:ATP-binding protein [Streptomyces sp. NPDC091272]|uniref:ATP-binding protein n=1 Tax=Streptomyces sp. NPDC091272 TaxID=3365981 RepID=UPI00381F13E8
MSTSPRRGRLPGEREDHFMCLPGAHVVSTRSLLTVRENIRAAIEARAMICIYGQAGNGKSFAVNTSLRELAPTITRRIQFRARPSTRDLRHELFHTLGLQGRPPAHAIEFDRMLRGALEEPLVLVCDEAQWLSKLCFEYLRYLWDDTDSDLTIVFTGRTAASRCCRANRCWNPGSTPGRKSAACPWTKSSPSSPPSTPSRPRQTPN